MLRTFKSALETVARRATAAADLAWVNGRRRWGVDPYWDLEKWVRPEAVQVVLDVGANVGDATARLLDDFPACTVHAFEPGSAAFELLCRRLGGRSDVVLNQMAAGREPGTAVLTSMSGDNKVSRLGDTPNTVGHDVLGDVLRENVDVTTIDGYCAAKGLKRVDLLKIDTEGHDRDVLLGASEMLRQRAISWIVCEYFEIAATDLTRPGGLAGLSSVLEPHGYRAMGLYTEYSNPQRPFLLGNALFGLPPGAVPCE